MPDVVVRGGAVVTPDGLRMADVACEDGYITAIGPELPGAAEEIDARGRIRRGETIFMDGRITARTKGHFVAATRTDT